MKDYGKAPIDEIVKIKQEILIHYTDSLRTYKQAIDALSSGKDNCIVACLGNNASFSHQKVLDLIRTPHVGDYKYLMAKKLIDVLGGVMADVESKGDTRSGFEIVRITPTELFYIKIGFNKAEFEAKIMEEEAKFSEADEIKKAVERYNAMKTEIDHAKEGINLLIEDKKKGGLPPQYRPIHVTDNPELYFRTLDERLNEKPETLVRDKSLIPLRLMIDQLDKYAFELNNKGVGIVLGERDPLFKIGIERYNKSIQTTPKDTLVK